MRTAADADWAYDFSYARSLEELHAALNAAGPWVWQGRDGAWYGSYLRATPAEGVRVRIHHFPDQAQPFSALLQLKAGARAARAAIDAAFRALLEGAGARDLNPIEPYD